MGEPPPGLTASLRHGLLPSYHASFYGAKKGNKLWYNPEGDYMEVSFEQKAGYFRETGDDRVMEKVDAEGRVLGFSIMKVSSLKGKPLEVAPT